MVTLQDPGGGVDVTLDDVTAHAVARAQRPLQIDEAAGGQLAQTRPPQGLGHEVGGEGVGADLDDRQTAPVDTDGIPASGPLDDQGGVDRQPGRVLGALDALDVSELLNDSGEHR